MHEDNNNCLSCFDTSGLNQRSKSVVATYVYIGLIVHFVAPHVICFSV